ncbi:hypothetical protein BGZ63DRAFT_468495 [Mariannaea sp. PMI_226]|nr:hypothetical protein BGZ63DRAFT_468495 [Mariannaea sp. PMI_226]
MRNRGYQRTYKACIACRQKKLRCIPDATGYLFGACARCKRESRPCLFDTAQTGKAKSPRSAPEIETSGHRDEHDTRQHDPSPLRPNGDETAISPSASRHGTAMAETESVVSSEERRHMGENHQNSDSETFSTSVLLTEVSSENDALEVLFQAVPCPDDAPSTHQLSGEPDVRQQKDALLDIWNQCLIVRQGLLSALEALTYTDLYASRYKYLLRSQAANLLLRNSFFLNLAPLSPVLPASEADYDTHRGLALNKPLLCCAILMISTRYHNRDGNGGVSRGAVLHERLWDHCTVLIKDLVIGQELVSVDGDDDRTHGNLQAFLLMVEWKPRAVHFSASTSTTTGRSGPLSNLGKHFSVVNEHSGRFIGSSSPCVTQPGKVSDDMSWMLLSCALGLVHRRVRKSSFDPRQEEDASGIKSEGLRLHKLLYIFIEQLSLRLGCEPITTTSLSNTVTASIRHSASSGGSHHKDENAWVELTHILRLVSDVLLSSKRDMQHVTVDNYRSGVSDYLKQQLTRWRQAYKSIEDSLGTNAVTTEIEYQYTRILLNSVRLRAIASHVLVMRRAHTGSTQRLDRLLTMSEDHETIEEVVDGALNILQVVINLHLRGCIRYIPVRIVLRTVTACVFLLKALSLDPWYYNLDGSLDILARAVTALRGITVDEMHLGPRYAALIEAHITRFKDTIPAVDSRARVQISTNAPVIEVGRDFGWTTLDIETQITGFEDWLSLLWEPAFQPDNGPIFL